MVPDAAAGAEPSGAGRRRWSWKRFGLLTLATALAVVAVLGGGVALGWKLANEHQATREPVPMPSVIEVPQVEYDDSADTLRMPDVRGLDQAVAEQVLADAGVPVSAVLVEQTPWAGTAGQVVEQHPVPGAQDPADILLTVATAAIVPELAGRTAADLGGALGALGAEVIYESQYAAAVNGGIALAIDPSPGQPLPDRVTITVAETAGSVMLATVTALADNCSTDSIDLDGVTYPSSLSCYAVDDARDNEWLLSKVVDSIEGTVGIPDTEATTGKARVEVLVDGSSVAKVTVSYGKPAELKVKASGALRLNLRITSLSPDGSGTQVGLGDLKLVGGMDALKKLEAR